MYANRIHRFTTALAVAALLALPAAAGVSGTVKYEGRVPNLPPLKMEADPGCAKKHSGPVQPELLVLGDGNTMANILIYVKNPPQKDYPVPSAPVVMDQDGCQYKPHVMGVMAGQTFKVHNSDGLLHNVHSLPKVNASFNRAMPANVKEAEYTFDKAEEPFKIKCDVHPWMGAYVGVFNHPFFAVTGTDGKFSIDGLPDGTYEVVAWHEKLPEQTGKVTVSGGAGTVDFTFTTPQR